MLRESQSNHNSKEIIIKIGENSADNVAKECNMHEYTRRNDWFHEKCQQEIKERANLRIEMISKGTVEANIDQINKENKFKKLE